MGLKPGYKQTEVGVIPEEWQVKRLGDLCDYQNGTALERFFNPRDGYQVISIGNYSKDGRFIQTGTYIDRKHAKTLRRFILNRDDLTMILNDKTAVGTIIGRVLLIDSDEEYIFNQRTMRLSVKDGLLPAFLQLQINSDKTHQAIVRLAKPGTQIYINTDDVLGLPIAYPMEEDEQRVIAEALRDVDALIGALDRLIAKKRDLKQAAMQQLLTGQKRLKGFGPTKGFKQFDYGSIPEDWAIKPFGEISTMNGRIGWQGLKQEEFTKNPDDPFLITGMNFKDGKIRWDEVYHIPLKRYLEAPAIQLKTDDVLITKDGTIGKLLFVDEIPHPRMASLNSHLLVFRPIEQQYCPKFLFYQLGSPAFSRHIELHKSGSTFFGLTQTATAKYPVILPSVPEQTAIAEVLSDMDAEIAALERRRDKTRALKQGMMQELLTGRTRLVDSPPSYGQERV